MSSSAIVAMFIPVVLMMANKTGLNRKRMLMPLSIATLTSGMMTLIASSPNMIIEGALRARGIAPFGFFSWTPFGLAVLATGISFILAARGLLSRQLANDDAADKHHMLPISSLLMASLTTCIGCTCLPAHR